MMQRSFPHLGSPLLCGNARIAAIVEIPVGITTIAWKTLRVFHNPLEKLTLFHIPTKPIVTGDTRIKIYTKDLTQP